MIGFAMIGFAMIGFAMIGFAMIGFAMIGFAMIGFAMIGFAMIGPGEIASSDATEMEWRPLLASCILDFCGPVSVGMPDDCPFSAEAVFSRKPDLDEVRRSRRKEAAPVAN